MAQQQKQNKKSDNFITTKKKTKTPVRPSGDLLDIIDNYLNNKDRALFWIFFTLSLLFTFLLFDLRVSVGGDDSTYIIKADDFIKNFKYPAFQGPLYPIVLSPFIAVFGINLPVLKLLSVVFLTAHLFFFYRAFRNNIPNIILFSSIILISINPYLLFFGSQTYTEAFLLMAQSLFFFYFFQNFIIPEPSNIAIKKQISKFIILSLIILALGLIKSVGYASLVAVIFYFLSEKKWKSAGYSIAGFGVVYGLWHVLRMILWGENKAQFSAQAVSLLQKHPYDPSQGAETFLGFIQRFVDNSNIYLSRQFLKIIGLRPELIQINNAMGAPDILPVMTILIYLVFIIGFIWSIKNNKFLKFTGLYMGVMMVVTFIVLQTIWEAHRLIITIFPLMMMFLYTGIYSIVKWKKLKVYQFILPVLVIMVFFSTFGRSTSKIKEHQKILSSHLRGNITAGFTPDWVNFINMSIWAAKNIPEDKVIASRKPSISFIYTNRRFFGIYQVDSTDPDTLLNYLHQNKVEYVVMASLRKMEAQKTDQIINTIQRYLYYIQLKYPEKIILINQIGGPEDEPAYLFKIE